MASIRFFLAIFCLLSTITPAIAQSYGPKPAACVVEGSNCGHNAPVILPPKPIGGNRSVTAVALGSSNNAYSILESEINRIAANNTLNTVVFIHRTNPAVFPTTNTGQYMYDVSTDGGSIWSSNNGPLNASGNATTTAGRYPNVVIYNPQGNTTPANAYLGYMGSWLPYAAPSSNWDGYFAGVARLNNNAATRTSTIYTPNNSNVSIAKGLCNGSPGVFWAVDWSFDGSSNTDILLYRGIWNASINDISWSTYKTFIPPHDANLLANASPTALNMAFDPSGRYGYVVFAGDLVSAVQDVLEPVVYYTSDYGATWSGPEQISLSSIDNIQYNLNDPSVDVPTTGFNIDIAVDATGKPHIAVVVGTAAGNDYSISTGINSGLAIYDITRSGNSSCPWTAYRLSSLATFRGEWVGISEDNRPQVCSSPDGTKMVFSWLDSDAAMTGGDNNSPNFFTRGINVTTGLATSVTNWTAGDVTWDGSALFASTAPTGLISGNSFKIPTVFAQLDPFTLDPDNPVTYHYIQNIQYTNSQFNMDITAPSIVLIGNNPMTVVRTSAYNEPGATATDNVGAGTVQISGTVNTNVAGTYFITYTLTDNAGNAACSVVRKVNVVNSADNTPPVITVIGANPIIVDVCTPFTDPGVTATDNVDGNITAGVTHDAASIPFGTLYTRGTVGVYTITYTVSDGAGNVRTATRTVNIVDRGPAITISGGKTQTVSACASFTPPVVSAFDNCDGFVTVTSTGTVNSTTPGVYKVIYTATDANSNISRDTLTVTVNADNVPPVVTLTGSPTVYSYLGDAYIDQLPTATDCSGIASINSNASTVVNTGNRGTYTVTYTVTDNNGNTSVVTRTVIVSTEPSANFTSSIVPGNPLRVKFSGQSLYNPTSWIWEFGDPNGSVSTTSNPAFTYPSYGTYQVCLTVRNNFNTPPFSKPADQIRKQIAVVNSFGVSVTLGNDQTVCGGTPVTLSPNILNGAPPYTVQWTAIGNSLNCSTCLNPTAIITQNSTYIIKVTDSDGDIARDTLKYFITSCGNCNIIANTPNGTLNPDGISIPAITPNVPYSQSLTFRNWDSVTISGIRVRMDYLIIDSIINLPCGIGWATDRIDNRFNNQEAGCILLSGTTSNQTGQYNVTIKARLKVNIIPSLVPYTLAATGLFTAVKVCNSGGPCLPIDTTAGAIVRTTTCNTGQVTLPTPLVVNIGSDRSICPGQSTSINPTITGGNPPYTYNWSSTGSGLNCNVCANNSITVTATSQITLIVTDANGLTGTATVTYSLAALPASPNIIGNTSITPQTSYTYAVTNVSGLTYTWTVQNGTIQSGQGSNSVTVSWSNSGPYSLSLVISNSANCAQTSYLTVVNGGGCNLPLNIATVASNPICTGDSLLLIASASAGTTYQWLLNGGNLPGQTDDTLVVRWTGTYQVQASNAGCNTVSSANTINFEPSPTTPVITGNANVNGCNQQPVTLTLNNSYPTYQWSNGANTADITVTLSGNYTVTVTSSNGCKAVSAPFNLNQSVATAPSICVVSVDSATRKNIIVWEKGNTAVVDSYFIYKESNQFNVFNKIGAKGVNEFSTFIDVNANPLQQADRYRIAILDTCGNLTVESDPHKTIHLTINQGLGSRSLTKDLLVFGD